MNSDTDLRLIQSLRKIVGDKNVLVRTEDVAGYVVDWTSQFKSQALAVVRPVSTKEVSGIVKLCAEQGIAVVPQGGRTGLCGGGVPILDQPSVVVSLTRMNAVRSIDLGSRTVVAEAGVVLGSLHEAASANDLVFPLFFGARGSCTLGGNLSTNAGGSNVVRYGTTRELCLGIEAVLPDGSIVNGLTGLRKDNTGYDLKDLLIGAEGTLGIITAAVFKFFPAPTSRATAFLSVPSLSAALQVLNRLQDHTGNGVEAYEYMPKPAVDVICKVFPEIRRPLDDPFETGILVELASSRPHDSEQMEDGSVRLQSEVIELLGDMMEQDLVLDAMIAQSDQQRADLWRMRESILEAITKNGPVYHLDLSLPLQNVAAFVEKMDPEMARMGIQPLTVGHLGDGNLHYALAAAEGRDWDNLQIEAAKEAVFDCLLELNGSFSAEHGIGQSKLQVMSAMKEPSQLVAMRAIKSALDPKNTMNPGKLIPS